MKIIATLKGPILVDDADLMLVLGISVDWYLNTQGYATVQVNGKYLRMHTIIAEAHGLTGEIDHQNHNKADNQFHNLRKATSTQNKANRLRQLNNTSGFKGVSHFRSSWRAYIVLKRHQHHLGLWNTPEEAARAYDRAAIRYFGEFACLNFPRSEYATIPGT